MSAWLRIVMPVLDEGPALAARLHALAPLRARGVELVVVDGGSIDDTWAIACALADRVLLAPRGRAAQMNAGARGFLGEALLFLHADTALPPQADRLLAAALRERPWGRFDVAIDGRHPMLPCVAWFMNRRSRLTGIATGDQGLFVRRDLFEAEGGFPEQALMEDIALSARLRRVAAPACIGEPVRTSGRRWDRHGAWRTIVLMWRLRAAYALGASPQALALRYGYAPAPEPAAAAVAVLAKAPIAGFAKTRLAPRLGTRGAARVQRRLARGAVDAAVQSRLGPVTVWCAPDARQRFFRALQHRFGVGLEPQPEGDLGDRMQAAVRHHFDSHAGLPLLITGTDCPGLSPGALQAAARTLARHDAVLVPAQDGGYVLIGLARPLPGVFEGIAWSTAAVAAQTRERLDRAGARWCELAPLWDIDEPADWDRLHALLHPAT